MQLRERRVVITGAASGMGRAGALVFAREGARLALVDIDGPGVEALAAGIRDRGGHAIAIRQDLSDPAGVRGLVTGIAGSLGGLDVLWNHAGINGPDFELLDLAAYDRMMAINLTATVLACSEAVPLMRAAGRGAILLTSSVAGLVGSIQNPLYSAAKSAMVGLTRSLAIRYAPDGIRVNAICPGPVDSPMLRALTGGEHGRDIGDRLLASIPMGRLGRPEEIAEAALWLASDRASFVTGVALPVDGGLTAR
ncbi:SDR family NAD(P)-dependent oxidoreductase (plasmid) [Tistrella mobilis]|uniref:SDR family NAD(P)-dependent oxidoreductase n=1 Tax=Tistrella mobilis TaxID=171437 RepID=UPI003556FD62